jgi:hypothetical protein
MAYSSGGLIQGADYNGFATSVNTLWSAGSGSSGYGQTGNLSTNLGTSTVVAASDWATMISRMNSMSQHQSSGTTTGLTGPTASGIVTYLSSLSSSITTLQSNKLTNYANFGTGTLNTGTTSSSTTWTTNAIFYYLVTFPSGDAARYFFNAGGQIQINASGTSLSGNNKSTYWNSFLNTGLGTWYIRASTSGYTGTGFTPGTNLTTSGYYQLTSTPTIWFKVFDSPSAADYTSNYIQIEASTTGGTNINGNGDTGNRILIKVSFVDAAADTTGTGKTASDFGDTVVGTTATVGTVYPPITTYLANTWGAFTNVGNVTVA